MLTVDPQSAKEKKGAQYNAMDLDTQRHRDQDLSAQFEWAIVRSLLPMFERRQKIKRDSEEMKRKRVGEIECELQVIRSPSLILKQLRFCLDDGSRRIQGKKKFDVHERGYEILKARLHQLECEIHGIQVSKRILEHAVQVAVTQDLLWETLKGPHDPQLPELEQILHNLKDEFEQKLRELKCQRQEILLRVAYLYSLLVWVLTLYAVHVEDVHEGGFRNLLLDGWWLEFWEIVLLAAGDVERNPGPRQVTDEQLAKISDTPISK